MSSTVRPADMLTHPVVVGSLGLLVLNDHLLKDRFHNTLTGKLSDVAGLVFFPVLVASAIEVCAWLTGRQTPSRVWLLLVTASLTAIGFTGIQTVGPMTELYRSVAGFLTGRSTMVVADLTDVLAVPACFVGWLLERRLSAETQAVSEMAGSAVGSDKRHGLARQTNKGQAAVENLETGCVG